MPWRDYFPEYIRGDFDAILAAALQNLVIEIDPQSGDFLPFVVLVDHEGELLTATVRPHVLLEPAGKDVLEVLVSGVRRRRDDFRSAGVASSLIDVLGEPNMLRLDVEMPLGDESLGQVLFVPYDMVRGEPRFGEVETLNEDALPAAAIWR